jgi:hypothetical protein
VASGAVALGSTLSSMARKKKQKKAYLKAIKILKARKKQCKDRECVERTEDKINDFRIAMEN